jgi:hypothetical protein
LADDLVSRDYRRFLGNQFPFDNVEVGAADAAVGNANQDFPAGGLWSGIVRENQRVRFDTGGGFEDAGFHWRGTPHPGCFAKRVCKLLKTKNGTSKKRAKRAKERAKRRQSAENKRVKKDWVARDDGSSWSPVLRTTALRHSGE